MRHPMVKSVTLDQCAEQLGMSRGFVEAMIAKGRLNVDEQGLLDAAQVESLAELLTKLKGGGIAAMITAIEQDLGG